MSEEGPHFYTQKVSVEWVSQKNVTELISALGPTRTKLCSKDDEAKIKLKIRFEYISRDPYDKKVFGAVMISSLRRNKTQKAADIVKEIVNKMYADEKVAEQQADEFRRKQESIWGQNVSV